MLPKRFATHVGRLLWIEKRGRARHLASERDLPIHHGQLAAHVDVLSAHDVWIIVCSRRRPLGEADAEFLEFSVRRASHSQGRHRRSSRPPPEVQGACHGRHECVYIPSHRNHQGERKEQARRGACPCGCHSSLGRDKINPTLLFPGFSPSPSCRLIYRNRSFAARSNSSLRLLVSGVPVCGVVLFFVGVFVPHSFFGSSSGPPLRPLSAQVTTRG